MMFCKIFKVIHSKTTVFGHWKKCEHQHEQKNVFHWQWIVDLSPSHRSSFVSLLFFPLPFFSLKMTYNPVICQILQILASVFAAQLGKETVPSLRHREESPRGDQSLLCLQQKWPFQRRFSYTTASFCFPLYVPLCLTVHCPFSSPFSFSFPDSHSFCLSLHFSNMHILKIGLNKNLGFVFCNQRISFVTTMAFCRGEIGRVWNMNRGD